MKAAKESNSLEDLVEALIRDYSDHINELYDTFASTGLNVKDKAMADYAG